MEFIFKIVTDIGQKCRRSIAILEDIGTPRTIYQLEGIITTCNNYNLHQIPWCTTLILGFQKNLLVLGAAWTHFEIQDTKVSAQKMLCEMILL